MDSKKIREILPGSQLVRLDEQTVEQFWFHVGDNGVAATVGTRNGPVCAPILRYSITENGQVQFSDHHAILFTWESIELLDRVLVAKCDQRVHRYTFTPAKKQERYLP